MTYPVLSIIVPCYNQAQYLPETLRSVLEQDLQNWECIIVNDGSPDNTAEVALQWVKKDSRFKYFEKKNGGIADARNFGINNSNGKYILPLDSDDKISRDYTVKAVNILEHDSQVRIVYCRVMLFGETNEECFLLPYTYENQFFVRNCIHCSGIYRRSDFDQTQGYNVNMKKGWEDYDFWLSILQPTDKVIRLDDYHLFYRVKNISRNSVIDNRIESELRLQLFKNHEDIYLNYINPLEIYKEAKALRNISNSFQYKLGGMVLAPFRYIRNIFNNRSK